MRGEDAYGCLTAAVSLVFSLAWIAVVTYVVTTVARLAWGVE